MKNALFIQGVKTDSIEKSKTSLFLWEIKFSLKIVPLMRSSSKLLLNLLKLPRHSGVEPHAMIEIN